MSIKWVSLRELMQAAAPASCPPCPKTRTTTTRAPPTCAADADLLAEIERLRERATTYGLVAAVAVALLPAALAALLQSDWCLPKQRPPVYRAIQGDIYLRP